MTPKLSNLDIPEIKAAAAEWALASSQIEKITLHRFKPSKLHSPEGPFYSIIIWVSREVDVNNAPWMEQLECRVGEEMLPKEHVREQYIAQDGKFDREKASKHPLYDLWNLFLELSAKESKARECLYSFYRDGFERPDPRFDWLVLLLNVGDEYVFDPGGIYDDLDNTEVGSVVLFSRDAIAPQDDGTTTEKSKTWNELAKPGWCLGKDIVEDRGITIYELFDLMKRGLQAYTKDHDKVVDSDFLLPVRRKLLAEIRAEIKQECTRPDAIPLSESEKKYIVQCRYDATTGGLFDHPKGCALMSFTEMFNNSLSKVWTFQFKAVDVDKLVNEDNQSHPLTSYEEIKKEMERKAWFLVKDRSISEEIQNETYESLLDKELRTEMLNNRLKIRADFEKEQNGTADEEAQAEAADSLLSIILDSRQIIADIVGSNRTHEEKEELKAYLTSLLAGSEEIQNAINEYNQTHPVPDEEIQNKPTDPSAPSNIDKVNMAGEPQQTQVLPERESTQYATAENPLPQNHNNKPLFSAQVWEEAVRLYEIIREAGFNGSDVDKKLQSAATKELKQNRNIYKYIKQKHLNKTDLFALNPGQERRDFIGKLLQKITGGGTAKRRPSGHNDFMSSGRKITKIAISGYPTTIISIYIHISNPPLQQSVM